MTILQSINAFFLFQIVFLLFIPQIPAVSRPELCFNELALDSSSRIFLIGDSILTRMFYALHCVHDWKSYTPKMTSAHSFGHLGSFRYANSLPSYLIGSWFNASAMSVELYSALYPVQKDLLFILFGAHSHVGERALFKSFMQQVYDLVAEPFPGNVFWFEPFPQHFRRGIYIDNNETKCNPLTPANNDTQFWRVEVFREVVRPTSLVHRVQAYDVMAPLWDKHVFHVDVDPATVSSHSQTVPHHMTGPVDCTHFTQEGDEHALKELYRARLEQLMDLYKK
jgi:hypothetical protein